MRILICLLSLLILNVGISFAQEEEVIAYPLDPQTQIITYVDVVEMPGLSANELFERAFRWANEYYINPKDVIRESDVLEGKLFCKARFKIENPADKKGVVSGAGNVMYSLLIEFKDDKYRYKIDDIHWIRTSKFPIEKWMDTENSYYKEVYTDYLKQAHEHCNKLVIELQQGMEKTVEEATEDW
ncbi:MAG: DUF4468 domain-containing protein [Bacteroidia bacterium]|nr:DUF4468 domain-containing protein [Bacteroidia bacterium]